MQNFNRDNTKNIYKKLFFKKDLGFYLLHSILLIVFSLFILFSIKWFSIPDTNNSLSANHIYLEYQDISLNDALNYLNLDDNDYRICYKFQSLYLDNRYHYIDILPHPFEEEGLYINQNAKDIFINKDIGEEVILNYYANDKELSYKTKIKEYIIEEDINKPIIYYGYEEFINYLKDIKLEDSNEYERMISSKEYVDILVDYDDLETVFEKAGNDSIKITSPLYQQRVKFINDSAIYKMIYNIFEIIILFSIFGIQTIFLNNNTNKNIDAFAILVSQGHKLEYLKRLFIKNKLILSISSVAISMFIIFITSYLIKINSRSIVSILLILLIYLIISIFVIMIYFNKIKEDKMNKTLKNRFD